MVLRCIGRHYPPEWTADQDRAFDAKVHQRQMADHTRWLRRSGLTTGEDE